jgi:hypothetical protein
VAAVVVAGTTRTTGAPVADRVGVGAAPTSAERAGDDVTGVTDGAGPAPPCGPPPTAQAMPAEPTSAAAPSSMTVPWRLGALCRPIVRVFHRRAQHLARGSMGG